MSNGTKLVYSIYSRPECHLCDDMLAELKKWQNQYDFEFEVFNIDNDSELTARYAARIPLLALDQTEICEYHFNEKSFLDSLNNYNKA